MCLLAVTKSTDAETAAELVRLGVADLAENRLEGLTSKAEALAAAGLAPRWHFVGHLQRNKMRRLLEHASVFHSIDRRSVLETLDRLGGELGRRPDAYLQVRLADGDDDRSGAPPADVPALAARAAELEHVELVGLMTMGPQPTGDPDRDADAARTTFDALVELGRSLPTDAFRDGRCRFSMGMSADLEPAIAAGADVVRIGRALVGTREPQG